MWTVQGKIDGMIFCRHLFDKGGCSFEKLDQPRGFVIGRFVEELECSNIQSGYSHIFGICGKFSASSSYATKGTYRCCFLLRD